MKNDGTKPKPDAICANCGHIFERHAYEDACIEKVELQGHMLTFSMTEKFRQK
jgi:hypothetical protein